MSNAKAGVIPQHVAIIMDGNGRWAKARFLPRTAGHAQGVKTVRKVIESCVRSGVRYLTLFAFSSENWQRPQEEVGVLMDLFVQALEKEVKKLNEQGVRLRVIGERSRFSTKLIERIEQAERVTQHNDRLHLTIAASYGGRWDIVQAMHALLQARPDLAQSVQDLTEADIAQHLSMAWAPDPDLFIRTGGEQRVSNFLIWQQAYSELYFTDRFWPEFDENDFQAALAWYQNRERRFGKISEQLTKLEPKEPTAC